MADNNPIDPSDPTVVTRDGGTSPARYQLTAGGESLQLAASDYDGLTDSLLSQANRSLDEANQSYQELVNSLYVQGVGQSHFAQSHSIQASEAFFKDGLQSLSRAMDEGQHIGMLPYAPLPVYQAAEAQSPLKAYAILTGDEYLYRQCVKLDDGRYACNSGDTPPPSIDDWPWLGSDEPPPTGEEYVIPPPVLPPPQPDDEPDNSECPSPPPSSSCPPPTVTCPSPVINISIPSIPPSYGGPCIPCSPPPPGVEPPPPPDPTCEPANESLSKSLSRGWPIIPLGEPSKSDGLYTQYYQMVPSRGPARRLKVTGVPAIPGKTKPKSSDYWSQYGLFDLPPDLGSTYAEWEPDESEPPEQCQPSSPPPPPPGGGDEEEEEEEEPCPPDYTYDPETNQCTPPLDEEEEEEEEDGGPPVSPPPPPPPRTVRVDRPGAWPTNQDGILGDDFCKWSSGGDVSSGGNGEADYLKEILARLGFGGTEGPTIPAFFESVKSLLASDEGKIPEWLIKFLAGVAKKASTTVGDHAGATGGYDKQTAMGWTLVNTLMGWLSTLTRGGSDWAAGIIEYKMRYNIPYRIPTQGELNQQLLTDNITENDWNCKTRANGNNPVHHIKSVYAGENRLSDGEVLGLWLRGSINDGEVRKLMRKNGWINDESITRLQQLTERIPDFSDIIRFMVRDAFNEQTVEVGQLDSEFSDNYKGKLKDWSRANGISEEVAKAYWRAHWNFPSNTQLYEMVRRLRKGRVDDKNVTTIDDALKVLGINDIAPGWRERLLAVSYNPITKTEIKQGYKNGAIDFKEMVERLQDTGLSKDDSVLVAQMIDREKALSETNPDSKLLSWRRSEIVNAYIKLEISEGEATELLKNYGMQENDVQLQIQTATLKQEVKQRTTCRNGLKRRYFIGEIDHSEAVEELVGIQYPMETAIAIAERWKCERLSKGPEIRAAKIQQLYLRGLIDDGEAYNRLINLGYSKKDAGILSVEMRVRLDDKITAENKKRVKELQAEERRRMADLRAKIRDAERMLKDYEKRIKEYQEMLSNKP